MPSNATSLMSGGQHLNLLGSGTTSLAITTAVTATVSPIVKIPSWTTILTVLANFTYGSGGTSADFYVQTSFDGGVTWMDIMEFGFTTASAKKIMTVLSNLSVLTPSTPGDAALTANTAISGFIGDRVRVKYTTVGTYAGATTIKIDTVAKGAPLI